MDLTTIVAMAGIACASVALAALADYLPVYSASVRSYAIELAARE